MGTIIDLLNMVYARYRIFEFSSKDHQLLPSPPTTNEKYIYTQNSGRSLIIFSMVSFVGIILSLLQFVIRDPILWPLLIILILSTIYFVVSLVVNSFAGTFDMAKHRQMVSRWHPSKYPSIDVFLPVAGEPLPVLANTWKGVRRMARTYPGNVIVHVLDDAASREVQKGAKIFGFSYKVRPNRGYFKKAGNLRYGYQNSHGDFIVIFDADFVPRQDFLMELLPYFDDDKIGLVQSPQYFDVHSGQNWLERGAGAVQELFYRFSQVSRQAHDASICVGSNAIYRRRALQDIGGTTLIEHSEDVHTGFDLRKHGWLIQYVPVIVAKGLCPSSMASFFKQQYRWCSGSLSLCASKSFWGVRMRFRTRLSYISGFMYYLYTALTSFYAPIIPLLLLVLMPRQISLLNYRFILPSLLFVYIVLPLWHKSIYGVEAWSTQQVYGWAHLFAVVDKVRGKEMGWVPTGAKVKKDYRYILFRVLQLLLNTVPATIWVAVSFHFVIHISAIEYLPIFLTGTYYLAVSMKVSLYGLQMKKVSRFLKVRRSPRSADLVQTS